MGGNFVENPILHAANMT